MGQVVVTLPVTTDGPATVDFPLAISADSRWLEYADGRPFLVNGDTAWSLFAALTLQEATTYLEDRAAKGVNLVLANLIEHAFTTNSPPSRNANGDLPFTGTLGGGEEDFTTPNEDYWAHVDAILDVAETNGIVVLALPAYVGFQHGEQGWATEIAANGSSAMADYGTFLGQRYASQPNLIWCMGGDGRPVEGASDLTNEINALANAIKTADTNHLMTAHSRRTFSSVDSYNEGWLDLNATYAEGSTTVMDEIEASWGQAQMPTFLIEALYGNEASQTDATLRAQMYRAILWGGVGHVYGNAPTWYFGEDATHPANDFADTGGLDWREQLDNLGAADLAHVAALLEARDLTQMTPDYDRTFATAGTSGRPVMASSRMLVAYTTGTGAITVDKSQFESAMFRVAWFNPRDGSVSGETTAMFGAGSEQFTPPDGNDWILLLDDQALDLPLPGE